MDTQLPSAIAWLHPPAQPRGRGSEAHTDISTDIIVLFVPIHLHGGYRKHTFCLNTMRNLHQYITQLTHNIQNRHEPGRQQQSRIRQRTCVNQDPPARLTLQKSCRARAHARRDWRGLQSSRIDPFQGNSGRHRTSYQGGISPPHRPPLVGENRQLLTRAKKGTTDHIFSVVTSTSSSTARRTTSFRNRGLHEGSTGLGIESPSGTGTGLSGMKAREKFVSILRSGCR